MSEDVASLKATIEALRETNRNLINLLNRAPAAIVTLDPEGKVRMWNPAAELIFGWESAEVVGQPNPIVPPAKFQEFATRHKDVVAGDTLIGLEVVRKKKGGEDIDISVSTAVVRDEAGAVETVIGVIFDITARKQVEREIRELNSTLEERVAQRTQELREAVRDLESFSYSVSHDLRSPLRSIDGFANVLIEDYAEVLDDEGRRLLGIIVRNAQRMGQLIDDLLEFSRMGRKPLARTSTDLGALAATILEELRESQPERTVEITLAELPRAQADSSMLRQVLVNLLSNAWKFTRKSDGARIEVGSDEDGAHFRYWVKDNGAGFDMQYADKLFGVFQRLHRQEEFEGTGVGLAICQKIVSRHGGSIWAEAAVGEGATFFFTLPKEPVELVD